MLHTTATPSAKREAFRFALSTGKIQRMPGAFTPISARLIEQAGFEGVYISGAVMSNELGLPDIGLTTLTEVAQRAAQISRVTNLPTLVDADTGFGEPLNVARTVQILEDAGVTALHIEDQVNPKRCGHLDGKEIVDSSTAANRIRAAVTARRDPNLVIIARTDIRGVDGLDAAIDRARLLVDAGADAIFAEAMATKKEFAAIRASVDVPILANMTEFGKSELFTVDELSDVGVSMIIYPVSLQRLAMGAIERGLTELASAGTFARVVNEMQTRSRLYEVLDYDQYGVFDQNLVSFDLSTNLS
jgi:methylisocitrate lyase